MGGPGIVRAQDRVAVWHEAAAPNSNKWKTPVNQLKKILDAIPVGQQSFPNMDANVKAWTDKYAPFVKTYLKPGYAEDLKAELGKDNYDKLLQTLPKQHVTGLTTHVQKPAPNSNKFKSPANGLKALMEDSGATPQHTKTFIDGHPEFAPYLKPEYADALKGHLGEANYAKLQQHLNPASSKAKQIGDDLAKAMAPAGLKPKTFDQFMDDHGDPKDKEPAKPKPAPKEELEPADLGYGDEAYTSDEDSDDPEIKAIQQHMAPAEPPASPKLAPEDDPWHTPPKAKPVDENAAYDHYMNTTGGNGPDWTTLSTEDKAKWNPPGHHHNQYTDKSQLEKNQVKPEQPKAAPTPEGGQDTDEIGKIHDLLQPASQPTKEESQQHAALVGGIKDIFPQTQLPLDTLSTPDLKGVLENWQKHLPHTPEHAENLKKIDALHQLFFGQGGVAPQPAPSPEQQPAPLEPSTDQSFGQQVHDAYSLLTPEAWDKMLKKDPDDPQHAKKKLKQLIDTWSFSNTPEGTKEKLQAVYDKQFGGEDEQSDIDAIKGHMGDDSYNNMLENSQHNDEGKYADTFAKPGFKNWWGTLDDEHKHYYENNAQEAVIDYTLKHGDDDQGAEPADQDDIDAIKGHQFAPDPDNPASYAPETDQDKELFKKAWLKVHGENSLTGALTGWLNIQSDEWPDYVDKLEDPKGAWSGPNSVGAVWAEYKKLKDMSSQVEMGHEVPDPKAMMGELQDAFTDDGGKYMGGIPSGLAQMSPDQQKEWLAGTIDSMTKMGPTWDGPKNKLKAISDKYFSGTATGDQGMSFEDAMALAGKKFPGLPKQTDITDKAGLVQKLQGWANGGISSLGGQLEAKKLLEQIGGAEGVYPPGFKEWAEEGGTPIEEYSPDELKAALSGFQKEKGGQSVQPVSGGNGSSFSELAQDKKFLWSKIPAILLKDGKPEGYSEFDPGVTAWLEGKGLDGDSFKKLPFYQNAVTGDKNMNDLAQQWQKMPDDEKQKWIDKEQGIGHLKEPGPDWKPKPAFGDEEAKYGPKPAQGTGIKVGPHAPKDMLSSDGSLSQQAKEYLDASGWSYTKTDAWQPQDWKLVSDEGLGGKSFNGGWEAWKQQHGGTPGGGNAPSSSGTSIPNVTPEELKKHLIDVAGWDAGAIGFDKLKGKNPEQVMAQLKVWADNGTGGSATKKLYDQLYGQVGPPKFDPQAFGKEYLDILPSSGSSLGSGGVSPDKAKQKLDQLISDYPGTTQTKKLQQLKDKWFGGSTPAPAAAGATGTWNHPQYGLQSYPTPEYAKAHWSVDWTQEHLKEYVDKHNTGGVIGQAWAADSYGDKAQYATTSGGDQDDIDAISDEADNLPPPAPAKPFKSEKLNPVDLKNWAQKKPSSAVEWKQFANWWGDTQLTPQQEGKLYNTWFNKNANPEQAGKWFQQVFEQNSAPGEGDLGTEGTPGWAHNNWAFGHKADKEWPVFKAWAAKDPGFPKGTTLKQKVAIWNGLSDDEKAGITGDYMPEKPIDTGAVVSALKKAYPDSDWSNWSKLTQGKLESNLKNLGGSFGPAAKIYNQYFDGKLEVPKEDDKSTPKGPAQAPPEAKLTPIPEHEMGEWVGNYVGPPSTQGAAMAHYVRWAKSVGLDSEISKTGYYSPQAYKQYQGIPDEQKQAIKTMGTLPWHTKEEFKAWQDAQPSAKNELKKLFPEKAANGDFDNYTWDGNTYSASQKSWLTQAVKQETDPAKKQALLGIYHQFYGAGQPTLAEHLTKYVGTPPELKKQSWDQYLQSHTPDDVAKLLKKKLKNEPDPEKWIAYVDAFKKYVGGPSGHKWVTQMMGKGQGTPNNYALQKLFNWKKGNGSPQDDPYYSTESPSNFLTKDYPANTGKAGYLKYIGWAPPPGVMSSFKGDPALYGDFSKKTYTAPEIKKGKQYQTLLKNSEGGDYSINDKKTMGSESFQHWFESAPQDYRDVMSDHPGIAIDDFAEFMKGGTPYSPVPEGGTGKQQWFDVSPVPFAKAKTPGAKDLPNFLTWNPPRPLGQSGGEHPKFPRYKDEQETIPLPAGQHWAPHYAPMPIYRVIRLNTTLDARDIPVPSWVKDRKLFQQQQAAKLSQIDEIINGKPTVRDPKQQEASFDQWASGQTKIKGDALQLLKDDLFSVHPNLDLGTDKKWKILDAFGTKYKNAVPATEVQNLAKQLGIMPPTQGNYDHPDLAKLILDYMEGYKGPQSGDENANIGLHWTRDIDKAYEGVPSAGGGARTDNPTPQSIPVTISGYWDGRGEGSGEHSAYDPNAKSELEQNLKPNAPVLIKRLQIRSPDNDWHDLVDYGPISMWPPGRDETASGHRVWDKPSLANLLSKALPGQQFKTTDWDSLTPGVAADNKFAALMHEYAKPKVIGGKVQYDKDGHVVYQDPDTAAKLGKLYRDFFVGRPDLPTKPHYRRASLDRVLATNNPDDLTRLMAKWGTKNPERYGGQHHRVEDAKEFVHDVEGVAAQEADYIRTMGFGQPSHLHNIEAAIDMLAAAEDAYDTDKRDPRGPDQTPILPGPWWHASDAEFKPGDILAPHPGSTTYADEWEPRKNWVWMSHDSHDAQGYGKNLYEVEPLDEGPHPWNGYGGHPWKAIDNSGVSRNEPNADGYVSPRVRVKRRVESSLTSIEAAIEMMEELYA